MPTIGSHWHEITDEERYINKIFDETDNKLYEFLDISNDLLKNNYPTNKINEKKKELSTIIESSIRKSLFKVWKILDNWINQNQIFKYFHEIWGEVLYLTNDVFQKIQKILENNPKLDFNFHFKDKGYWEIFSLVGNVYSGFDKFSSIYFACNAPLILPEDLNKNPEKSNEFKKILTKLSFSNIGESLKKILKNNSFYNDFLKFNEKIVNSTYWKENYKQTRNDFIHGYFGYYNTIDSRTVYYNIFFGLYILLRSLWYIEVTNFDTFDAIRNIFSTRNDSNINSLLKETKTKETFDKADILFSNTTIKNSGSGIDEINLVFSEEEGIDFLNQLVSSMTKTPENNK